MLKTFRRIKELTALGLILMRSLRCIANNVLQIGDKSLVGMLNISSKFDGFILPMCFYKPLILET
jgi:hypothetical protein